MLFCLPLLPFVHENEVVSQRVANAKKDTIDVVGHAHMDQNWLWTTSETMKMCDDNLRQTVAFMKEFKDFTMIQSMATIYSRIEKNDPPLFERMKKYIKEGRLELGGGMWDEGDENLSSGEALSRSFLLGQRYFLSRFGKIAKVGWLPDDFGHVSQFPQILKLSGCNYFYFMRCSPYLGTFWWIGPDSSRVLCYNNNAYSSNINQDFHGYLNEFSPNKHLLLEMIGIGDHGGGPTRDMINKVHQLDTTHGYPTIKFTTAEDFFKKASSEMNGRPTHRGEMQFVFEGCYTTVSDIKAGNRNCENALYSSEFFNTLNWLNGGIYPAEELRNCWKTVVFNEFHDILCGSAINEANKEAIALYYIALRNANNLRDFAFHKLADEVKFKTNMGQPVVAFNLHPYKHKNIVEAEVYSHKEPATAKLSSWGDYYDSQDIKPINIGQGDVPTVLVRDGSGKTYPAQIIWGKTFPPGYMSKVQFVVNDLPAGGYKTFYIDMTKPGKYNEPIPLSDSTFETDFFKVKFDMKTGNIISLFDKRSNKEYVKKGSQLNKLRIYLEDKKGGMKSWVINKIVKEEDVKVNSVRVIEDGPVRACVETVMTWGKSRFIERTYLYRSYPRIDYDMEVQWLETGSDSTDSPMLRVLFPFAIKDPRFYCQVPFDVVERPIDGKINGKDAPSYEKSHSLIYGVDPAKNDGQEAPAQKWADVTDGKNGIALLNKTKYGYSYHNGDLRLTLMRSAGSPDIYPNLGKFNISYALYPHTGDWGNGVWEEGDDFNVPVYAAEPPSLAFGKEHASRPEEASFFSVDAPNVILSGTKQSENGKELIVRLVEVEGKATTVTLKVPVPIRAARRLNLLELPLENTGNPIVNGQSVKVKIRAHEIVTLGISLVK
jgi:alpha-mannosidase